MVFPYLTFSNQEIDNLATSIKNVNSILKAHPVFDQMRQGCSQHLKETPGLAFSSSFSPFLPPGSRPGAGAALRVPGRGGSSSLDSKQG